MTRKLSKTLTAAAALAVGLTAGTAFAEYPTKPITLVAPYSAGGASDLASRTLASVAPTYIGQPVLVPGSMGTASWVLVGTQNSMNQTFGSTCHGAGRRMSRKKAKKSVHGPRLRDQLESRGIHVRAGSMSGLAEEAPAAYKDVNRVVDVVHGAGIARKVARLTPVAVIKG